MYRIQTLNKISPKGLANLDENYEVSDTMENPDAILVRSASMHEMEMPASLKAIARAGAGAAASVVMMLVPVTVFIVTQSNVIETMSTSGMKE